MRFRNLISAVLAVVLALCLAGPAYAADPAVEALEAKRLELEEKYGISIRYDLDADGITPSIGTGSLATLDTALSTVTPSVVRQVSSYYYNKLGRRLTYSFVYSPHHTPDSNVEVLGSFQPETAVIELYVPSTSAGTFTTGNSPITIVHEFGHAFYIMFIEHYGEQRMEQEWVALNNGVQYNPGYIAYRYNRLTFMSGYGTSRLEEDFAELFSHAFVRHREGQGFQHLLLSGGNRTPLGNKLDFIARMLPMYLTDTDQAVANLNRAFTTPISMYYQGVRLSGEELQFMGCVGPRYVLNGILGILGVTAEQSDWISDIGGWQVRDSSGRYFLVFPGGAVERLNSPLAIAA